MQEIEICYINSTIGPLAIKFENGALTSVQFDATEQKKEEISTPQTLAYCQQIDNYLNGETQSLNIPLKLNGTAFQNKVWNKLQEIPYGKTISYSKLAAEIGDPKKVRAVANAIGKNPIPIVIPCHRVVGKGGQLTGYLGGLERKHYLLSLENKTQLTLF